MYYVYILCVLSWNLYASCYGFPSEREDLEAEVFGAAAHSVFDNTVRLRVLDNDNNVYVQNGLLVHPRYVLTVFIPGVDSFDSIKEGVAASARIILSSGESVDREKQLRYFTAQAEHKSKYGEIGTHNVEWSCLINSMECHPESRLCLLGLCDPVEGWRPCSIVEREPKIWRNGLLLSYERLSYNDGTFSTRYPPHGRHVAVVNLSKICQKKDVKDVEPSDRFRELHHWLVTIYTSLERREDGIALLKEEGMHRLAAATKAGDAGAPIFVKQGGALKVGALSLGRSHYGTEERYDIDISVVLYPYLEWIHGITGGY